MADGTKIEWCDSTWQVVTGCSVVSPGCTNCYAMRLAGTRMKHHPSRQGLTQDTKAGPVWTGEVRFNEQWLDQPLRWRKPRRIFVAAHGDLFAEGVPDEWIDRVFAVMALCPQHTFLLLTKRAKRMRDYIVGAHDRATRATFKLAHRVPARFDHNDDQNWTHNPARLKWPLPRIWLGVSVEDQQRADERLRHLLPLAEAGWLTFISAEPLLGPVDLTRVELLPRTPGSERAGIHVNALTGKHFESGVVAPGFHVRWVIVGGESGPGARPMLRSWAQSLRDQCQAAGVAYFHKQNGEWIDADEWLGILQAQGVKLLRDDGDAISGGWNPTPPLSFDQAADLAAACNQPVREFAHQSDGTTLIRVGKRAAGRLLDGREWSEFPA